MFISLNWILWCTQFWKTNINIYCIRMRLHRNNNQWSWRASLPSNKETKTHGWKMLHLQDLHLRNWEPVVETDHPVEPQVMAPLFHYQTGICLLNCWQKNSFKPGSMTSWTRKAGWISYFRLLQYIPCIIYETYKKQQKPKSIAKYQSIQILFVNRKSDMLC